MQQTGKKTAFVLRDEESIELALNLWTIIVMKAKMQNLLGQSL